uniref:Uncharacterized protein n=1 Tax=Opuntia streptacantha TaxID=393608 RepID=A0A7C9D3M7_OPUST
MLHYLLFYPAFLALSNASSGLTLTMSLSSRLLLFRVTALTPMVFSYIFDVFLILVFHVYIALSSKIFSTPKTFFKIFSCRSFRTNVSADKYLYIGKTAYILISPNATKVGPTVDRGGVVVACHGALIGKASQIAY